MRKAILFVVVAALVALATLPIVAIGAITGGESQGPTAVYTQTDPDECLPGLGREMSIAMQQDISTQVESNVLVLFTTRWGRLNVGEEGLLSFSLATHEPDVTSDSNEWSMSGTPSSRTTQSVMWTFDDIQPGTHTAYVWARVDPLPGGSAGSQRPVADVTACAFTVFVMPVAGGTATEGWDAQANGVIPTGGNEVTLNEQ